MPAEDNSQGQYAGSISRLYDRPRLEEVNVTQWGLIPFEVDFWPREPKKAKKAKTAKKGQNGNMPVLSLDYWFFLFVRFFYDKGRIILFFSCIRSLYFVYIWMFVCLHLDTLLFTFSYYFVSSFAKESNFKMVSTPLCTNRFQVVATELDKYRFWLWIINFNIVENKSEKANIFLAWKLTTTI